MSSSLNSDCGCDDLYRPTGYVCPNCRRAQYEREWREWVTQTLCAIADYMNVPRIKPPPEEP